MGTQKRDGLKELVLDYFFPLFLYFTSCWADWHDTGPRHLAFHVRQQGTAHFLCTAHRLFKVYLEEKTQKKDMLDYFFNGKSSDLMVENQQRQSNQRNK